MTALHFAAHDDDRATVAALLGARADVNTKNNNGCAICRRRCPARGRRWPMVTPMAAVPAPSGRWTALHSAAANGSISAGAELLAGGADQTIPDKYG
jgi:ankyrin repeat protein